MNQTMKTDSSGKTTSSQQFHPNRRKLTSKLLGELGLYVEVYILVTFCKVKVIEKGLGIMGMIYIFPFKLRIRIFNP